MRLTRQPAGFTLLEVLVAIVLLTGGVTALAQVFSISTLALARARRDTAAVRAASSKVEELRGTPWDLLADGADDVDGLRRRWDVEPLPGADDEAFILDIRVTPGETRLLTVRARSE